MKNRTLCTIASAAYLLFVAAFLAVVVLYRGEGSTFEFAMYALSTALLLVSLVLAAVFLRRAPSERYEEMDMKKDNENWEKR